MKGDLCTFSLLPFLYSMHADQQFSPDKYIYTKKVLQLKQLILQTLCVGSCWMYISGFNTITET